MKKHVHNLKSLKEIRKELRNHGTSAEAVLWTYLKKSQLDGRKFRRQHSVGPYVLDFYCPSAKLAVELDGKYHFSSSGFARDEERTNYLKRFGIRVIRFENKDVFKSIEIVLEEIRSACSGS